MLVVHVRSFLARHRALHWCIVASLAGAVAMVLAQQSRQLDRAQAQWGDTATVWVAMAALAPGDVVMADPRALPLAAIPDGALVVVDGEPIVDVVLRHVHRNEVLTAADVGDDLGELLPDGWRGVAIAADESTVVVTVGARVDVVADGTMLAGDGVVTAVTETAVTVGVPAAAAPSVAAAALERRAVIVSR